MKLTPKKTFLLRQEKIDGSKRKKDIVAHRGVPIEVTEEESIKFFGCFDFDNEKTGEADKKKVQKVARENKSYLRML